VLVISPHAIIRAGVRELLAPHSDVDLRESSELETDVGSDTTPDVVIYDVFGLHLDGGGGLACVVRRYPDRVLALSRSLQPGLTARAIDLGAIASISIEADDEELVELVRVAAAGHLRDGSPADLANQRARARELGRGVGLTPRERQVLALIVEGLSNDDIAHELFLSINTVKSVIRLAYQKIGATTRAQAVAWGVEHGFSTGTTPPETPPTAATDPRLPAPIGYEKT
jgi:DNA-binding NarL/FixJ family response regulator